MPTIGRLMTILMAICALVGCSMIPGKTEMRAIDWPTPPTIVFDKNCKDDHDPGVKMAQRPCSAWEYSLDELEIKALLHYLRDIEAIRERNP